MTKAEYIAWATNERDAYLRCLESGHNLSACKWVNHQERLREAAWRAGLAVCEKELRRLTEG